MCAVCACVVSLEQYGVAMISRLLKIVGLFCKRALYRDYILQKSPIILKSLLIVATPYLADPPHPHQNTHRSTRCTSLTCVCFCMDEWVLCVCCACVVVLEGAQAEDPCVCVSVQMCCVCVRAVRQEEVVLQRVKVVDLFVCVCEREGVLCVSSVCVLVVLEGVHVVHLFACA